MVTNQNETTKTALAPESAFKVALFHLSIRSFVIDSALFLNFRLFLK